MSTTTDVVASPDAVTIEWLTERLHAAGHRGEVRGFQTTPIGTGQIGLCVRFKLQVEGGRPGTPRSLVGKFPSRDARSRTTGVAARNYLKEVSFYRDLRARVHIACPRCYYADIVDEGPQFGLLLEDLAPAQPGDQLAGCTLEVAHAAVQQLVGLHAPSWCNPSLRTLDWIGAPDAQSARLLRKLYAQHLPGFLDRYGAHLKPDEAAILERYATLPPAPLPRQFSLVHVDYRLDNLLIDSGVSPPSVTVVDWQSITVGSPMTDVAYFLGAGLLPEVRREVELEIVSDYHAALATAGVGNYTWQDCWADYRRAAFHGFDVTVVASMLVGRTPRGDAMFTAMAQRHARHAMDADALGMFV